ncbi:hypothetical protein TNCV_640421 [Trichonephila clavipes]|nr:hypothetical protein TNCV_640421 [Trichonephila clavipes]
MTPELVPLLLTTTPHQGRTFVLWTDLTCIAPLQGTGLEQETPVPSEEDLITRISVFAGRISNLPQIFQNVKNFVRHRCQPCQMKS